MKKIYRLNLEVKTPVFVGSGEEIGKKEVIVDGKNNRFIIVDPVKLFREVRKRDLTNELEKYFMDSSDTLTNWLRVNDFSSEDRKIIERYSIIKGERVFNWEKNRKPVNILTFIKDPFDHPYIPGSSLKGALRTGILGSNILKESRGLEREERLSSSAVEKEFFSIDPLNNKSSKYLAPENDIFRGLQISDSLPLSTENLICLQQVSFNSKNNRKPHSELPIYREYLLPGTRIKFRVSIDHKIFPYTSEELLEHLLIFQRYYENMIRSNYIDEQRLDGNYITLGGGAGYASKGVTHPLFKDNYRKIRGFARERKGGDKLFPSQLRGVRYDGKILETGLCSIDIEEDNRN